MSRPAGTTIFSSPPRSTTSSPSTEPVGRIVSRLDVPMKPATKGERVARETPRGGYLLHHTVSHHGDARGHGESLFLVVRHVDERGPGSRGSP